VHLLNHTYNQKFLDAPIGASRQPLPPFEPPYALHPVREVIPLRNIEVVVRGLERARARLHPGETELAPESREGLLVFKIPELGEHALLEIVPSP